MESPRSPGPLRVYFAARYSRRGELRAYADEIAAAGGVVASRWLYTESPLADLSADPAATEASARRDLDDVRGADVCVSFTEGAGAARPGRGGRHVELGVALAAGLRVILVGPPEHVFHGLPEVERFEQWEEAFAALCGPAHERDLRTSKATFRSSPPRPAIAARTLSTVIPSLANSEPA